MSVKNGQNELSNAFAVPLAVTDKYPARSVGHVEFLGVGIRRQAKEFRRNLQYVRNPFEFVCADRLTTLSTFDSMARATGKVRQSAWC
jgi:hypothetical protein